MHIGTRGRLECKYRANKFDLDRINAATTILAKAIRKLKTKTVVDSSAPLEERASVAIGLARPQAFVSGLKLDEIRSTRAFIETIKDEGEKNYLRDSLLSACQDIVVKYFGEFESDDDDSFLQSPEDAFECELSSIFNSIPRKWQDGAHVERRAEYLTWRLCYVNIKEDLERIEFPEELPNGFKCFVFSLSRAEVADLIEEINDARAHDRVLSEYGFVDAFIQLRKLGREDGVQDGFQIANPEDAPDTMEGVFYRYDDVFRFTEEDDWEWYLDYDEYEGVRSAMEYRFEERFKKAVGELLQELRNGELDEDDAEELRTKIRDYVPVLPSWDAYLELLYDGDETNLESRLRSVAEEFDAFNFIVKFTTPFVKRDDGKRFIFDSDYAQNIAALEILRALADKTNDPREKTARLLKISDVQFKLGNDPEFKKAKTTVREILTLIPQISASRDRLNAYRDLVYLHCGVKYYYGEPDKGKRVQFKFADADGKMTRAAKNIAKLFVKEALNPDVSGVERDFYLGALGNVDFLRFLKTKLDADDLVEELLDARETEYAVRRIRLLLKLSVDRARKNFDDVDALAKETLELIDLTDPLGAVALTNDIYDALVD